MVPLSSDDSIFSGAGELPSSIWIWPLRLARSLLMTRFLLLMLPFVPMDENIFPVHLKEIQAKQVKDRDLRQKVKTNPSHFQKTVVEQVKVITYKNRLYVPKDRRTRMVKWYHHYLYHPGEARMHKTLASTLYWEKMKSDNL